MGMVIHDDYVESCEQLPNDKQKGEFLLALVRYGTSGIEPKGNPPWLPTFTALKKRVKLGRTRSEAKKGKTKDGTNVKPNQNQNETKPEPNENQNKDLFLCVEDEVLSYEVLSSEDEKPHAPFGLRCLGELNEVLGTSYTTLPSKSAMCLSRMEGKYDLAAVRRMVEFKRDEWRGTKFSNNLTPNTLFGPDHFEQYMHQASGSEVPDAEFNDLACGF